MCRNIKNIFLIGIFCFAGKAYCQDSSSANSGLSAAMGVMAMSNSTRQGGQGTEGSTLLTQFDATWNFSWWALGLFTQYDKQGDSETDFTYGPRLEVNWQPFYLGFGYMVSMTRNFTDRAIESQSGSGQFIEVGVRSFLDATFFIQSSYKMRTQKIVDQDGQKLGEPIIQEDGYPLFGLGMQL